MKERLDILLVKKGMFPSREKAKASIMAGLIRVDGQIADKAGTSYPEDSIITVKSDLCPYVSRGGLKLEKAIKVFHLDLKDTTCVDMGASTGGFTDCMLVNGASRVYSIDVGYGQLDWKLRNDPRVINMEKINIRYMDTKDFDSSVDFISIDVSFISLKLIFPVASRIVSESGSIIALVKPQFEAGREQVGKNGIVRDIKVRKEVLNNVIKYGEANGLYINGLSFSPITGTKGNVEFLLYLKKTQTDDLDKIKLINEQVDISAKKLDK